MKKNMVFFSLLLTSLHVFSEDIELYLLDANLVEQTKPQVLLMVDTSGSMSSNSLSIKTPFDPAQTYAFQTPTFGETSTPYLYYVVGSSDDLPSVDAPNENRRFKAVLNNCSTATSRLNSVGFYTGRIREYTFEGNVGTWQELSETDGQTITIVDCEDDINLDIDNATAGLAAEHNVNIITTNASSAIVNGYPVDGAGSAASPVYYNTNIDNADVSWGGDVVTLYTDKYLRWEQGTKLRDGTTDIGESIETRLNIAKRTLVNLIDSIPSVKFGLQVYNFDQGSDADTNGADAHGGRIAFGIQEMNATAKGELLDIINNDVHGSGWTPLCESYYEAYRYFAGLPVTFGKQDVGGMNGSLEHFANLPPRDTTIESGDNYIAPYAGCSDKVFVILITDGEPSRDAFVDADVQALKDGAAIPLGVDVVPVNGNYLPVLSAYMNTNDINANLTGTQTAQLYTVGFSGGAASAAPLLQAAATNGGGVYYDATDPTQLGSSLQEAITSILTVNTSFTAPSVATNSFDRTETIDSAYYAMFEPSSRARWSGNLKKLKIVNGKQVDRFGDEAINDDAENLGSIKETAKTFWSTSASADGNQVTQGGVVEMFSNKNDARNVYTDTGTGIALNDFTFSGLVNDLGNANNVHTAFGVSNSADAQLYIDWALGIEDNSAGTYTYRSDLFGDPLHSKPVAINYGGTDVDNPDIRIVVGTNAGVLHMFQDFGDTVDESWAFMPQEFFPNIKTLKDNLPTSTKVYGVDGRITTHIVDNNGNGTIDGDDKVWIFFGLRRGGTSYYALDITIKDTPKLLWKIDGNSTGFAELGQTWSQPQIGFSSANIDADDGPKPVLIFGAGYSIAKDTSGPGSLNDSVGRGIYMVDAESGALIWSATPAPATATNTQFTGLTDSISSRIATLDSDGDGLIDRLYTGDTGGNVFRIDMPGNDPDSSTSPWTIFKLAELGGASESPRTNLNDRRFLDAPSIVRTFFTDTIQSSIDTTQFISQERPYEAILIGSGDRTSPNATDTSDEFFMILDENVVTQSFIANAVAPAKDIPTTITYTDLYDFTNNPFGGTLTPLQLATLNAAVSEKSGWRFNYSGSGEKSTAGAIVVNGAVYFTSFQPGAAGASCELVPGDGSLYVIDLYKGTNIPDSSTSTEGDYVPRKQVILKGLPDTPVLISTPSSSESADPSDPNTPPGIVPTPLSLLTGGLSQPIEATLRTSRSYQYITEEQ